MTLATVAAYFSLNQLPGADKILSRDWPVTVAELIKQQLIEPLEEIGDRLAIPSLTAVDEGVSLQVMQQYEQNPYPRWTSNRTPSYPWKRACSALSLMSRSVAIPSPAAEPGATRYKWPASIRRRGYLQLI